MDKDERQAMMKSMMEQLFGGMGADEKKEMCATMMSKMTEGLDMKDMMPRMMMGMMSGGAGEGPGKAQQMPEMMLTKMVPHCIAMMLPEIDADRRAGAAAAILSAIVEKGTAGMSEEQSGAFLQALDDVLHP
jgi:hypothetical protein